MNRRQVSTIRLTRKSLAFGLAFGLAIALSPTMAAVQGTLGPTSNGSSAITITKGSNVQITGIADLDLGTFDAMTPGTFAQNLDTVCVFSSGITYQMTLDQSGGIFQLTGAVEGDTLPYSVIFIGGGAPVAATPGTPIPGLIGNSLAADCLSVDNATFQVQVAADDFNLVSPDAYAAVLTFLVEPE